MKGLEEYLEQREILALLAGNYEECRNSFHDPSEWWLGGGTHSEGRFRPEASIGCFFYAEKYWKKMVQFQEKVVAQCKEDEAKFGYSQDMSGANFPYACASFGEALREICPACATCREGVLGFLADSEENTSELLSKENSSYIFRRLVSNRVWFSEGPGRLPGGWSSATPEIVREWAENALSE